MQFNHNFGGHPPIDFPEAQFTRCQRVPIVGTTGTDVAWTHAVGDIDDDDDSYDDDDMDEDEDEECLIIKEDGLEGYWLRRTLKDALYGRVRYAVLVRRRVTGDDHRQQQQKQSPPAGGLVEWFVVVGERCAVKEMLWTNIHGQELVEDPRQEVKAMQYIQRHYEQTHPNGTYQMSQAMLETRVMMSRDVLDDDTFMYSVMPYCEGGEFYNHLFNEKTGKATTILSEDDARRWIVQILEAIETMQRVGVVHRDISLENLMLHGDSDCLVIDMGMALRIPYENVTAENVNNIVVPEERGERFLIGPLQPCGKPQYMSPEIFDSQQPFDGHAVDLWAVGVMLFAMVTGSLPWDMPCSTDPYYDHICRHGHLEQLCACWNLGLSPQLIDLLQRMLRERPIDRLSLEQIRAHPWMGGGG